jgi:protocatechuate 3,4-dioxygenase beta subunit
MRNSGKGLVLLGIVAAAVAAVGFWMLNGGDSGPKLERSGGTARSPERTDERTAAAVEAVAGAARLDAERSADPERVEGTAPPVATTSGPVADHLVGRIIDERGAPVAGAEVSYGGSSLPSFLRGRGGRGGRGGPPGRGGRGRGSGNPVLASLVTEIPSVRARSGADGSFRLEQPSRNEGIELRIDHPDFVVVTRNDLVLPASGLDLGTIKLVAGGTVSGFVYGPGGAKLSGAEVTLVDPPQEERGRGFIGFAFGPRGDRRATTDEEGRFRLTGMPAGKALVEASSVGLVTATSEAIEVVAHQAAGEVALHLERGFSLSGVVRDADGRPVMDAAVTVNSPNDWMRIVRSAGEPDWITSEDGRYEISGLKPGPQTVAVMADGFARHESQNVDPAQTATLDITLGATLFVAGRVELKGSSEAPRAVKVQLVPNWGGEFNALSATFFEQEDRENKATANGEFRVEGVEPGDYRIVARGEGTTRGQSEPFKIEDGRNMEGIVVQVERAGSVSGRVLDPGGAPIAAAAVRLVEPQQPQSGNGSEFLMSTGIRIGGRGAIRAGRFNFDGRRTLGRSTTDGEGRFTVDHLVAGNYDVELTHADFAMTIGEVKELATAEQRSGVDFRMNRGGTIEGTILAVDGTPRSGDRVNVQSKAVPAANLSAVADGSGYYRVDHVPSGEATATREEREEGNGGPGDFAIVFAGGGPNADEPEGKTVMVEEGATIRVDFSQQEKPVLEGVVTCADGPVAGATVTATEDVGGGGGRGPGGRGFPGLFGPRKEATTGPDGRYRITDLSAGSWRVSARHPQGLVATNATVTLAAGTPARQDFALEGGVIEGRALQAGGKLGIGGALVSLERVHSEGGGGELVTNATGAAIMEFVVAEAPGGGRSGRSFRLGGDDPGSRASTAADGSFRIPWVPAGKYRVRISHPEHLAATSSDLDLATDAVVRAGDIELGLAARLKVHVRNKATGQPVTAAAVTLSMEPDGHAFAMTDEQGVASFDNLAPGSWSVTLRGIGAPRGRSGKRGGNRGASDVPSTTVHCEAGLTAETTIDQ